MLYVKFRRNSVPGNSCDGVTAEVFIVISLPTRTSQIKITSLVIISLNLFFFLTAEFAVKVRINEKVKKGIF